MKASAIFLALGAIHCSMPFKTSSTPLRPAIDDVGFLPKRSAIVPTLGAPGQDVHVRLEIRTMHDERPHQWTLLLLALKKLQARAQSKDTSYYQISGIYGVPQQDYNDVPRCSTCSGANGYGTHDSVLFLGWHRVYIAHFEEQFVKVAQDIADMYQGSEKETMKQAAASIRWPYWDWAVDPPGGGHTLPSVLTIPTVTVMAPSGQVDFPNPLRSFTFRDPTGLRYKPYTYWDSTLRYPSNSTKSAHSRESDCIDAMDSIQPSLRDQVYQLFSTCKDFKHVSNDAAGLSSNSCSNSLEGIHNTVHTVTGGIPTADVPVAGHMNWLDVAAFDPLFWLHHANIDRLFAMWQVLNPDSYGASQHAPQNTWTISNGSVQNADSDLTPFYRDGSGTKFWTTNLVRNTTVFHYNYPEFISNGSAAAISGAVNKLYGNQSATPPLYTAQSLNGFVARNGSSYEYVANIEVNRYALKGSFCIFLFLGKPTKQNPSLWTSDPNLIGLMGVPALVNTTTSNVAVTNSIPLTRTLRNVVKRGPLDGLTEKSIEPFLQENLNPMILGPDGAVIDKRKVPGFRIGVFASTASRLTNDTSLPEWSSFVEIYKIV